MWGGDWGRPHSATISADTYKDHKHCYALSSALGRLARCRGGDARTPAVRGESGGDARTPSVRGKAKGKRRGPQDCAATDRLTQTDVVPHPDRGLAAADTTSGGVVPPPRPLRGGGCGSRTKLPDRGLAAPRLPRKLRPVPGFGAARPAQGAPQNRRRRKDSIDTLNRRRRKDSTESAHRAADTSADLLVASSVVHRRRWFSRSEKSIY